VKKALKSGHFWAGLVVGVILLTVFPQFSPRTALGKPKRAG
jgi:hypothetical protein